jgi:hypothetical protein
MVERSMIAFVKTKHSHTKQHSDFYEATANSNDSNASWNSDGQDNLQKIVVDAFDSAIVKLKTQYEFYEGQDEDIIAVLSRYPFLLADLHRIHEIKCQYFDEAPLSLCYLNETGWLEDADLAVAVVFDDDLWDKKFASSFYAFQRQCWREMSKESHGRISVGFE